MSLRRGVAENFALREGGGGLVATEQAGLYDEWRRIRVEPALKNLLQGQTHLHASNGKNAESPFASQPQRKTFGGGRTVYIPLIEFDGALPPDQPYFTLGTEFWKRPKNWRDLVDVTFWAAGEILPVSVAAPDFVAMNLLEQTAKRRRIIHLVNYDTGRNPFVANISIRSATRKAKPVTAVRFYAPGADGGQPVEFRMEDAEAIFTAPRLGAYGVITVSW